METIKEGWLKFTRFHCKEGYIDRWIGDANDDPNSIVESSLKLNLTAQYYRCNGGVWILSECFNRHFLNNISNLKSHFSADEIFAGNRILT